MAVAGVAAGHNAVEQVNASGNRLDNVAGSSDPHEVPGFLSRHMGFHRADDPVHILRRFSHGQAADGVAVQIQVGDLLHVLHPEFIVDAALVDAEQQLVFVDGFVQGV